MQRSLILSTFFLIAINMIPLVGALFFGWNSHVIVFGYWMENIAVGIINFLKIRKIETYKPEPSFGNSFLDKTSGFFVIHYGMFTFVHGIFITIFFFPGLEGLLQSIFMFCSALLSHYGSYRVNFLNKEEYKKTDSSSQLFAPYGRIVALHLTIILGSFALMSAGSPIWGVAILVLIKTSIDSVLHIIEHNKDTIVLHVRH